MRQRITNRHELDPRTIVEVIWLDSEGNATKEEMSLLKAQSIKKKNYTKKIYQKGFSEYGI